MFTKTTYHSLSKINIPQKIFTEILKLMSDIRPFDFEKELPETIHLIYCDCSDRSIEDDPCDGYTCEFYPNTIFVDPESRYKELDIISHELVHILQKYRYLIFKDEYEDKYRDRWFEDMAFKLELEIGKLLRNTYTIELITDNTEEIEEFLTEIMVVDEINFDDLEDFE